MRNEENINENFLDESNGQDYANNGKGRIFSKECNHCKKDKKYVSFLSFKVDIASNQLLFYSIMTRCICEAICKGANPDRIMWCIRGDLMVW